MPGDASPVTPRPAGLPDPRPAAVPRRPRPGRNRRRADAPPEPRRTAGPRPPAGTPVRGATGPIPRPRALRNRPAPPGVRRLAPSVEDLAPNRRGGVFACPAVGRPAAVPLGREPPAACRPVNRDSARRGELANPPGDEEPPPGPGPTPARRCRRVTVGTRRLVVGTPTPGRRRTCSCRRPFGPRRTRTTAAIPPATTAAATATPAQPASSHPPSPSTPSPAPATAAVGPSGSGRAGRASTGVAGGGFGWVAGGGADTTGGTGVVTGRPCPTGSS